MEVNQMFNRNLKEILVNTAIGVLEEKDMITEEDFKGLSVGIGYIFKTKEQQIEALFKLSFNDKEFYFAAQKGKLMIVDISASTYEQIVNRMKIDHPCLTNDELPETEVQKKRREKNNKIISDRGVTTSERLMTHWEDSEVQLKDMDTLCKRALASFFTIQIACDINNGNYEESIEYFKPMLEKFGLMDQLNSKEKRIVDGTYSRQDAIDMDWAYESYWAVCWCLGLVEDISDVSQICDCDQAIRFVRGQTPEQFMEKCKLRDKEEILDILDLYFRYHWAINDSKVNPEASIDNINPSIILERRRGLEWVVSDEEDWYDLSMYA